MVPPDMQKDLDQRTGRIKIDAAPWLDGGRSSDMMITIKSALENCQVLRFDYRDIKNRKSTRELEPYRLLLKGEDWYIQGYCLTRGDFRTFKLLRISNLQILEQLFEPREFPYEQLDFAQFNDPTLVPVKLRIHENIRDTIVARFGEDCLTPDGTEHFLADTHMPVDDLGCRYLLALGDRCVCLEPEAMRTKMREITTRINSFYQ